MAVLNNTGTAWDNASLIGGEDSDSISSVSLDSNNGIQVFGNTDSAFFQPPPMSTSLTLSGEQGCLCCPLGLIWFKSWARELFHLPRWFGHGSGKMNPDRSIGLYLPGGITEFPNFPV